LNIFDGATLELKCTSIEQDKSVSFYFVFTTHQSIGALDEEKLDYCVLLFDNVIMSDEKHLKMFFDHTVDIRFNRAGSTC
jgi:hypothetical protein